MTKQLYIGIDIGITTPHEAAVFDPERRQHVGKPFKFDQTQEGFQYMLSRVTPEGVQAHELVFCMEPTSMAWLPLSVFLIAKGYRVYRVTPQKTSDLRKFFKKHGKSNSIDAKTLAKLPFVDPEGVYPLYLSSKSLYALERYCRQRDKIMSHISSLKNRAEAIFTFANPKLLECFGEHKFTKVARAVMRKYADPFAIKNLGVKRLVSFLNNHAHGKVKPEIAQRIYEASVSASEIYKEAIEKSIMPVDFKEVKDEINLTLDTTEFEEKQVKKLDEKINQLYRKHDPHGILKSQPGFGDVIAPVILSVSGDPDRFRNVRAYKAFCGSVPRKKQTGNTDRKGLPITGTGSYLLKKYYHMAAETARKYDLEDAEFYNRLKGRGHHHNQAVTALADKMAGRTFTLLKRMKEIEKGMPLEEAIYHFRDLQGKNISKKEARELVLSRYPSKKRAANSELKRGSLSRCNQDNSSNKEEGSPLREKEYHDIGNLSREKTNKADIFPVYDESNRVMKYATEPVHVRTVTKQVMDELRKQHEQPKFPRE